MSEDVEIAGHTEKHPIQWEFYFKTKFNNEIYVGFNPETKEYSACSTAYPWFFIPPDKSLSRVRDQIEFTVKGYEEYLSKAKIDIQPNV